ncbi:adenylate kinase [Thermoplasma volcanium GSS1]|uniref:Adenylate kinase n=1 Tax=Thermoplasma volcanium (strain ATCC 51530 / DSM 4299 / JCM 9571 / NBRC 15438 / GSS1) TaxID=273116 RepID=KADA_THEVO|nr:adenylate kinase [Thermoplasma volcanium]Q97BV2.1 RecName: Full=Adenylate kinase; Short=AK; AltName: Full=ATP-AMP transphosphorylase [Thermoplasma volcanium GSS1]BAB59495.1 adenylate kinase [Thermoplasma volcanium GSS1]
MRSVITGVAGVGKTTVLDIVARESGIPVVNYGTLMFEVAKRRGLVENRDQIRKLSRETQVDLQKLAGEEIGKMENAIVDTHMSIKTPFGYLPGLPEWVLRSINASVFVIIEADPAIIKRRRDNDPTRARDDEGVDSIREHQEMNRYFAAAYSIFSGATVKIVKNEEGKPEQAADEIVRVIK